MVASALLFSAMGACVKLAAESLPNAVVVFFRNALGLAFLYPWLLRLGRTGLSTRHLRDHLVRGLAGLGAMYCFFHAIAHMRLADAMLLNYSLPLFVPFIERAWLGEAMPSRLWLPIGLGFGGLLLILKPGASIFQPVALVGLLAAVFAAVAQVGVRRLTRTEPITRIVFYFSVIATGASALPACWSWRAPSPQLWGVLVALGLFATFAQLLMTRAYAHAPAARVGPFVYTSVVFAGVFDWWLWRKLPDPGFVLGAALVCVAGAWTLRRPAPARLPPA
jgi:drug/metabolite transporter (DMT)-like permease